MGRTHFGWLVGPAIFLEGCVSTNYTVVVDEDKDQCSLTFQGTELVTSMVYTDGCIKWIGDKCRIRVGTLCEELRDDPVE